MKRAVIIFLLGLGALYLVQGGAPRDWFDWSGPSVAGPSSLGNIGKSVGGAFKRTADQF